MTNRVHFKSRSGADTEGELSQPAGEGRAPGVVLIQEWWGVNDHIRSLAKRLSDAGFVTVAPDLYHGKTTKSADEAGKMMGALDWGRAIDEIAGALDYLAQHPRCNGQVGVMGFCMGGALTFASACNVPEVRAAVSFYGVPDPKNVDYNKVTAPILAHVATHDQWVTPDKVESIKAQLDARGQPMEVQIYDAQHAFVNDTRPEVHNPAAAKLAWDRSMNFLHKTLD